MTKCTYAGVFGGGGGWMRSRDVDGVDGVDGGAQREGATVAIGRRETGDVWRAGWTVGGWW